MIVEDFYNKVAKEIMKKYFPTLEWYRDNYASQKAMYQLELFNNGCLEYKKLVKKLAKYCMEDRENIDKLVSRFITNKNN